MQTVSILHPRVRMNILGAFVTVAISVLMLGTASAQTMIPLPAHATTYSGMVRGYYFTAPCDFLITGVRVPTDANTGAQSIQLMRHPTAPPAYPGLATTFVNLGYWYNVAGTAIIPCNVLVYTGDVIAIIGYRATTNSYSQSPGPYSSTIAGLPITLTRCGHQGNIDAGTPAPNIWSEATGAISRVEIYYTTCGTPTVKYGAGCAGSGAFVPDLAGTTCATIGKQFDLIFSNALGGALVYVFGGTAQGSIPLSPSCNFLVMPVLPPLFAFNLGGSGPGAGTANLGFTVPPSVPVGLSVSMQYLLLDSGAPDGIAGSNGLWITFNP